jgi:acyl-CoA synthetase (AMP-forming)/AMP-acid ligase II
MITVYDSVEATDEEIQQFAREHLASYKIPRSIDRTAEIPRSPSGKVLKKELRAPWWEGRSSKV